MSPVGPGNRPFFYCLFLTLWVDHASLPSSLAKQNGEKEE